MNSDYAWKLELKIRKTNVGAQKTDASAPKTFGMVIANLQIENKIGRPRFFWETFLMANIKFEVILEKFFLKMSNADVLFDEKTLT